MSSDKAKDYVRIAQSSQPAMVHPRPCVAFRAFKRIFDITSACLGLVLLSPLLLGTALAVKATSPGPVIFKQERYGRNKKPFVCFKFRSMMADTPADVPTRVMHENQSVMTPIGATLRKTSIDELPQLLNIVRGDMSVVGPRPTTDMSPAHARTASASALRPPRRVGAGKDVFGLGPILQLAGKVGCGGDGGNRGKSDK